MPGLWDVGEGTGKYSSSGSLESTIVNGAMDAIFEVFKQYKPVVFKLHGGHYQRSGIPDLYIALNGVSLWLEGKRPGGDTTALQKHTLTRLKAAGDYVGTFTSKEEAVQAVWQAISDLTSRGVAREDTEGRIYEESREYKEGE